MPELRSETVAIHAGRAARVEDLWGDLDQAL
jgi:hypothetical protein